VKEIVQKILETERVVRESIDKARADAQAIVRQAEDKSRQVEEGVRHKAMQDAHEITDRIAREATAERERQIAAAQGGSAELIKEKRAEIKGAAERAVKLIKGIEPR
jgi:V/A-type H+/Na+-transporting ATPase subunit G/H